MVHKNFKQQFLTLIPVFLAIYIPSIVLIAILFVIYRTTSVNWAAFTSEPAAIFEFPSYYGLVTNIGVLLLCASTAVCFFCFKILRIQDRDKEKAVLLLFLGIFTLILTVDDFFLIHEAVGDLFAWGFGVVDDMGEAAFFILYAVLFLYIVIRFRKVILSSDYILLIVVVLLFVYSTVADLGTLFSSAEQTANATKSFKSQALKAGEDISKFVAIVTWFTYLMRTSLRFVQKNNNHNSIP
ncbi:MAG: hypothetical protein JSV32_08545 [Dehalococcoidia bacterium]|nr:MAG: hypothetical protein JSV32_08545 [Dehalococcoidia bacterium]